MNKFVCTVWFPQMTSILEGVVRLEEAAVAEIVLQVSVEDEAEERCC